MTSACISYSLGHNGCKPLTGLIEQLWIDSLHRGVIVTAHVVIK